MAFSVGDEVTILGPYDQDRGADYIFRFQHHGTVAQVLDHRQPAEYMVRLAATGHPLPPAFGPLPEERLARGWIQVQA